MNFSIFNFKIKPQIMVKILTLLFMIPLTGYSQYFGRNKVQYETFDFKVLRTENFSIYHYPREDKAARDAGLMLERWNNRFTEVFGHTLSKYQPIILYANHADFQQTNVIGGLISQGTGGVTEGAKNRIVLPLTGIYQENDHVLGHELVHAFQFSIMKSMAEKNQRSRGRAPTWFIEGMAEYLSIGREDPLTAMWLRDAIIHDNVPSIGDVARDPKYFPYRWGHALWTFLAGKYGDPVVAELFRSVNQFGWKRGFKKAIEVPPDSLSQEWIKTIKETHQPDIEERTHPKDVGKRVLKESGDINLAPSVSPDGKYVAYLSNKDLFSIDLFLADLEKDKVIKKLASSNTDAHFDALRFMNSAGAWSPSGDKFAFAVFKDGDNQIAIMDISSKEIIRTIRLKGVNALTDIAWSPDGNKLAVAGNADGIGDLYLYNLEKNSLKKLTTGPFAEIQPKWSPDGEKIVLVTDRGQDTDLSKLKIGAMKIGIYEVDTGEIELVSMEGATKHINPHFSPNGKYLYFVADPDGVSNVFRYSFSTNDFVPLTNVATGVSGLTELSPTLSVSSKSGRIIFTLFNDTHYHLHVLEPEFLAQNSEQPEWAGMSAQIMQQNVPENPVDNYLASPVRGLPTNADFSTKDYDPSLQLISVGQTGLGIAVDRFGVGLGGAVSFLFSDMLGNRNLGIAAQINGGLKDLGGQAVYLNRRGRLNWGGAIGHIPYQTARIRSSIVDTTINDQEFSARKIEFLRQRVFVDRISPMATYPLSTNRRLEFTTGYTRISYDLEVESITTIGNTVIEQQDSRDLDAPSGLNLFQTSAAYVGDYSFFGFTSPVNGKRFRFEVEPTVGTLNFLTVIADYRHYFFWNPLTIAFRGMHQGRYLEDAGNDRLTPLFLGYQTMIRGYDIGSFSPSECTEGSGPNQCAEFDRLIGTRIGVFNVEMRLPLFGTEQFGLIDFGFLPTELVAFFDGGVAWSAGDTPEFTFEERSSKRIPVFSAGVAARVNLAGYLIGQFYYAFPFQRPEKTAQFGFVIAPGW